MSSTSITSENVDRVFSVEVAAGFLGLSHWTLRSWIKAGKIKSCKLGSQRMIPMSEVNRLISESMQGGADKDKSAISNQ